MNPADEPATAAGPARLRGWRGLPQSPPRARRHSLQWRLVALFLALALGTTLVFVAGTREVFSTGWREMVRPLVSDYVDRLAAEVGDPPDLARAQALAQRLPVSVAVQGPRLQWASRPSRRDGPHDPAWRALLTRHTADGHELRFGLDAWRWADERPRWFGGLTLAALLALTLAAWFTVHRLFRPLNDIRAGARRYEAGDFSQPIPAHRRDEWGELADRVNAMAGGLQRMLEGQRGLLLAISHELRSPLTRARLNAELLDDSPERQALLRDLAQMRDLIAGLLEGERLTGGAATLHREPTDLNRLVRDLVAAQFEGQPLVLDLDPALPTRLLLDPTRLQLLVRNLLDNALRHGGGATMPPVLRTRVDGDALRLSVRDHGPGVDAAALARLTEPFYRPDAARTRDRGGVGLGLYLCRLVAQSHGGRLDLRRAEPGLEVSLVLPKSL